MRKYHCVKQLDQNDCGAACLVTVARQYGLKIPINKIRELSKTDLSGTTAAGIKFAFEKIGFSSKIVRVSDKKSIFGEFPKPAIAHIFRDNTPHFVVIHKVTKKYILVADPSEGIKKLSIDMFLKYWSGILIVMIPNQSFNIANTNNSSLINKFWDIIKVQKSIIGNAFIASLLITLLGIVGSFYYRFLIDDILKNNSGQDLLIISSLMIVLIIFKTIVEFFRNLLSNYLSQNIDIPLLLGYFYHVIELPMDFFRTRKVGEIISRFNDGSKIRTALSSVLLTIMIDLVMAILGGIILYKQSNKLFMYCFIPLILYSILVLAFKKPLSYVNQNVMEDSSKLTSYLIESIEGIEVVKSFNAEKEVAFQAEKRFINFIKSAFKHSYVNILQLSLRNGIKGVFGIFILWSGAYCVISGELSIGTLISFNALLVYFLEPIERVINLQPEIQSAIVAAKRLGEILDLEIEKDNKEDKKIFLPKLLGNIRFDNVEFAYNNKKLVLNKLNINIKSGEKIALVGESGSGKTTIAKLLMNFYDVNKGAILLDSYNIRDIKKDVIRKKIAYISQEFFFFSGTILENLKFANKDANYEDVINACKKAQIHEYINSLPLRYETLLVEKGVNFSGGQRQRLSIARAILAKPDILIMDEATSNLDSITESAIENTLDEFTKGITTIVIAHKLSTVKKCDKIYVIENGTITEEGNHNKLIMNNKKYSKLYYQQCNN
ncbi:MAG: peptidase domain-containing ABC transporter [Clostridium sp.]